MNVAHCVPPPEAKRNLAEPLAPTVRTLLTVMFDEDAVVAEKLVVVEFPKMLPPVHVLLSESKVEDALDPPPPVMPSEVVAVSV